MYGLVTRNEPELEWSAFDVAFYEVKDVSGRAADPVENAVNMVSFFGDNAAVESNPDLAAVDDDGRPATRERPYFDWDYVCPTHPEYREGLLEIVEDAADANDDVRFDDVGFPRDEYCHCDRCDRRFEESEYDDREDWRAATVTGFVADAAERVHGKTYLTVYPDPYPGHLARRSGVDLDALAEHVDEFVVPIYDTHYGTTYWVETLVKGFRSRLDAPFAVELYAAHIDVDALVHAAEVVDEYVETVLFGYGADNAQAAIRRMQAERNEGDTYRPEDAGG